MGEQCSSRAETRLSCEAERCTFDPLTLNASSPPSQKCLWFLVARRRNRASLHDSPRLLITLAYTQSHTPDVRPASHAGGRTVATLSLPLTFRPLPSCHTFLDRSAPFLIPSLLFIRSSITPLTPLHPRCRFLVSLSIIPTFFHLSSPAPPHDISHNLGGFPE